MYRNDLKPRDRAATILLVVLVHVAAGFAFLHLSGRLDEFERQANLAIFDVPLPPPPPPPVIEQPTPEKQKPKKDEGAASPKNIESKATPVVRPKPKIEVPAPPKIIASPTPNTGAQATQGASNTVGPGTGAGGAGNGTGSGGAGGGSGGGGGGGASGVHLVRGFTNRDYPNAIQRSWPPGGAVFARVRVEADGRVSRCDVQRSFGNPMVDQWTCALVMQQRAQFTPARDASGRPIAAWFGYVQRDTGRFER